MPGHRPQLSLTMGLIQSASPFSSVSVRMWMRQERTSAPIFLRASRLTAGRNAANTLSPVLASAFLARNV